MSQPRHLADDPLRYSFPFLLPFDELTANPLGAKRRRVDSGWIPTDAYYCGRCVLVRIPWFFYHCHTPSLSSPSQHRYHHLHLFLSTTFVLSSVLCWFLRLLAVDPSHSFNLSHTLYTHTHFLYLASCSSLSSRPLFWSLPRPSSARQRISTC
jgi:hypothetical protein